MKPTYQSQFFEDFKAVWYDIIGVTPELFKEKLVQQMVEQLSIFKSGLGVSALTVFDIEKNSFLFVDDDIERVTGIPKTDYFSRGTSFILSRAVLEHIPLLISSTIKQRFFFRNKSEDFHNNYIVNREFAYKSNHAPVNWVLHQVVKHLFNPSGKLFAVVVLQTQLKNSNYIGKFRYYIYDKKQNDIIYPKQALKKKALEKLTQREKEVVTLLLQNKSNKSIAETLYISYHTVRTHRKKAMKKLNCHSIYELAAQYASIVG